MQEPNHFTEERVLEITRHQGYFKVSLDSDAESEKCQTILSLVNKGYLHNKGTNNKNAAYELTQEGREYLNQINLESKHKVLPEVLTKGIALESVINKRLNILRNANRRGLEFNLTDSNIRSLLNKKTCYYTGHEFDTDDDPLNVRTFERIDDSKGYIQGNVVAVTLRANRIKNMLIEHDNELNIGLNSFIKMAEQIKKHQ